MRVPHKTYQGRRTTNGCVVYVIEENQHRRALDPRLDLRNHSPTGFEWGYGGSGPAQLSLALLADATGDDEFAMKHYQAFKAKFVQRLKGDWTFTSNEIIGRLEESRPVRTRWERLLDDDETS